MSRSSVPLVVVKFFLVINYDCLRHSEPILRVRDQCNGIASWSASASGFDLLIGGFNGSRGRLRSFNHWIDHYNTFKLKKKEL